jgi:glycosyltransferase involved in cell wall biosynthesis
MPDQALTIVICLDHAHVSGGLSKVAIDSAIGLKRAGMRPILFAAAGPVAESLQAEGVETICLGQTDLLGNSSRAAAVAQGTWNFQAASALARLLSGLPRGQTIVHVHGWAKALSPSIAKPIADSNLPAVYTIHEYFLFCPNGGFYNYRKSEVCRLEPLSASCWLTHCDQRTYGRKLWRNARLTMAQTYAHLPDVFSDFIAISNFQRETVARFVPKRARLHQLSNPVSVADLGRKPDPAPGDIVFVGRLSPEKGPYLFAEAARKIGLVPVFVGDGPIAGELSARFPEARILGWQPAQSVTNLMRAARALVLPSLWYEGQPLAVLEAKSLGVPVVVADSCAGRDEVEDGVTGLWFKGGDAEDLARALCRLKDDAFVGRLSAAGYASYWADPRTLEKHVAGLLSIYRDMIRPRTAPIERVKRADEMAWSRSMVSNHAFDGHPNVRHDAPSVSGTRGPTDLEDAVP